MGSIVSSFARQIANLRDFGTHTGEYNVRTYGAVGDGTTDDTAAINAAITALNAAGRGRLRFPAGVYKTSGNHTIAVPVAIVGDGTGYYHGNSSTEDTYYGEGDAASSILCTSATNNLFVLTGSFAEVHHLHMRNVAATTPTAGSAIACMSTDFAFRLVANNLVTLRFWIGIDHQTGTFSVIDKCVFGSHIKYHLRLNDLVNHDSGDGVVANCHFLPNSSGANVGRADAAIRWEGGGGWKFIGNKIVDKVLHGIWIYAGSGIDTSQILIGTNSIDGVYGNGIRVEARGTGQLVSVLVSNTYVNTFDAYEPIYCGSDNTAVLGRVMVGSCVLIGSACTGKAAITFDGNINATLGTNSYDGVVTGLFSIANGADVADGGTNTGQTLTHHSCVGTAGPFSGVTIGSRSGAQGWQFYSDVAGNLILYDFATASPIATLNNSTGLTVTTLNATTLNVSTGTFGAATVGTWAGGSGYAALVNTALAATANDYAILQDSVGNTYANAAAGKALRLRNDNIDVVTVTGSAVTVAQPLTVNAAGTFTTTLGVSSSTAFPLTVTTNQSVTGINVHSTATSADLYVGLRGTDAIVQASSGAVRIETSGGGLGTLLASNLIETRGVGFDGGGSIPTTGTKGQFTVPYAGTIVKARVLLTDSTGAAVTGSAVVGIVKGSLSQWQAGTTSSIVASAPPTVSSAKASEDTTLTGWTTAVSAGDVLEFSLTSVTTATRVLCYLDIRKA